jgi:hypothetical protein
MSTRLFKYLVNADIDDQKNMGLQINANLQTEWKRRLTADPNCRVHDLGDAFLHALDEIVCKMTNYRQLMSTDPVLNNNRSTILYFMMDQVYWVTVSCYFNKFVLEDIGSCKPNYERRTYLKEMNFDRVIRNFPDHLKLAMSAHDGAKLFPPVDCLRIIVRQTSHYDRNIAAQLGSLTNRVVEAMEYFVTGIEPSSKESKTKIPHYRYLRTLSNGKQCEVVRSSGKHTNNIITLLDWITKYHPSFAQSRAIRLAPLSQFEFYQLLLDASQKNASTSGNKACTVEMIEISPAVQRTLVASKSDFAKGKIFGDLILDVLNQNQKHIKAIANHHRTKKLRASSRMPPPLQRADSGGSKRKQSKSPLPMDTNEPACTCGTTIPCSATKHLRINVKLRR